MALVRVFSKIDTTGKIAIPKNVLIETGLKIGDPVEIKVTGGGKKYILISSRFPVVPGIKARPRSPIQAR